MYVIGLLFFFIVFSTSLITYRNSGNILVAYASFFIWIEYFWSMAKHYFNPKKKKNKVFGMITFTQLKKSNEGINQFMAYKIPYW